MGALGPMTSGSGAGALLDGPDLGEIVEQAVLGPVTQARVVQRLPRGLALGQGHVGARNAIGHDEVLIGGLVEDPDLRQASRVIDDDPLDSSTVVASPEREQVDRAVVDAEEADARSASVIAARMAGSR